MPIYGDMILADSLETTQPVPVCDKQVVYKPEFVDFLKDVIVNILSDF